MHGPKQHCGVRRWRITESPCRGDSHEHSNEWSPTMGLLSGGLGYGVPPAGWAVRGTFHLLAEGSWTLIVKSSRGQKGSVAFGSCHARSGRWCRTLSGRNPGRCLSQIHRTGLGEWENYGSRHSGRAPESQN